MKISLKQPSLDYPGYSFSPAIFGMYRTRPNCPTRVLLPYLSQNLPPHSGIVPGTLNGPGLGLGLSCFGVRGAVGGAVVGLCGSRMDHLANAATVSRWQSSRRLGVVMLVATSSPRSSDAMCQSRSPVCASWCDFFRKTIAVM